MANAIWVAPSLIIPPASDVAKAANPGRQNFNAAGAGVGTPVTTINLSSFEVAEGAAEDTVVGTLTVDPPDSNVTLTDNAGGYFALSDGNLVTTASAIDYASTPTLTPVFTAVWGQKATVIPVEIDVIAADITDVTITNDTLISGSSSGTLVGSLISDPAGANFILLTNTAKFGVFNGNLYANTTPTDKAVNATEDVTIRAVRGGKTYDATLTITIQ